ncbi:hypothetical protein AAF712_001864 [Marasmius tenuissimus]|uniref:Terpene synthase n=1 Tax=Marasmius tenuissimus TaxID=585030 RepID=A0ABR3AE55_9AGAR
MSFFFVADEYTDVASSEEARRLCDIVKDALVNPHIPRPAGEWIGGEIARQFWENSIKTGTPSFQRRFVETFGHYLDAVAEQAIDRNDSRVRDVETYFEIRRKTIGALPSFAVLEIHMNLPDYVFADSVISRLMTLTVDMIILCNDFCSYNVEQARGDDTHNIIRVFMDTYKTDIQGALGHVSNLHDQISQEFLDLLGNVPKFGDSVIDSEVSTFVDGLANWVRANDCWSFESHRYFGSQGAEIQETRVVKLLPKVKFPADNKTGGERSMKTIGESLIGRIRGIPGLLYNMIFGFQRRQAKPLSPAATEIVV